jgi:hypothetical protein
LIVALLPVLRQQCSEIVSWLIGNASEQDLGGGLGVTDPVSGPVVLELK